MAHFTEEQLKELATVFGLTPVEPALPVRDGTVTKQTMVWWRGETGPEQVRAGNPNHWGNIQKFPQVYQLTKPQGSTRLVYD